MAVEEAVAVAVVPHPVALPYTHEGPLPLRSKAVELSHSGSERATPQSLLLYMVSYGRDLRGGMSQQEAKRFVEVRHHVAVDDALGWARRAPPRNTERPREANGRDLAKGSNNLVAAATAAARKGLSVYEGVVGEGLGV